jgi:hypothetical protein
MEMKRWKRGLQRCFIPFVVLGIVSACGYNYEAKQQTNLLNTAGNETAEQDLADIVELRAMHVPGVSASEAKVENQTIVVAIQGDGGVDMQKIKNSVRQDIELFYPTYNIEVTADRHRFNQLADTGVIPYGRYMSKPYTPGPYTPYTHDRENLNEDLVQAEKGQFNAYSKISQGFHGPQYYKGEQRLATELEREAERIPGVEDVTIIYRDYQVVAGIDVASEANEGKVRKQVRKLLERNSFNVHVTTKQELHGRIKEVYEIINHAVPGAPIPDLDKQIMNLIRDIGPSFTNPLK